MHVYWNQTKHEKWNKTPDDRVMIFGLMNIADDQWWAMIDHPLMIAWFRLDSSANKTEPLVFVKGLKFELDFNQRTLAPVRSWPELDQSWIREMPNDSRLPTTHPQMAKKKKKRFIITPHFHWKLIIFKMPSLFKVFKVFKVKTMINAIRQIGLKRIRRFQNSNKCWLNLPNTC